MQPLLDSPPLRISQGPKTQHFPERSSSFSARNTALLCECYFRGLATHKGRFAPALASAHKPQWSVSQTGSSPCCCLASHLHDVSQLFPVPLGSLLTIHPPGSHLNFGSPRQALLTPTPKRDCHGLYVRPKLRGWTLGRLLESSSSNSLPPFTSPPSLA